MIHMPHNSKEIEYVVGTSAHIDKMKNCACFEPFSSVVLDFFSDVSSLLLKRGKLYSDVVTFAFWCRKAALLKLKEEFSSDKLRLGRGIVFHSTPSNVPVNFAFSFAAGLLAGNMNIVRLPAKNFPQVEIICSVVNEVLEKYPSLKDYVVFLRFKPSKEMYDYFSAICAVRIVWGGNQTIANWRKSPLAPRAKELSFADRYSLLVLNADEVIKSSSDTKFLQDFYNDTYFSDQNACTAPRMIIWTGTEIEKAKTLFWRNFHAFLLNKYVLAPVQAVGKLHAFYKAAAVKPVKLIQDTDQLIMRIEVDAITDDLLEYKYNSGFFFEYSAKSLEEILPVCTEKCQTLAYYGFDCAELKNFVKKCAPRGIDRMVPLGQTMNFSLIWDGYNLIDELSRLVEVN